MSESNNCVPDDATVIVLDTPTGSLSSGTERVVRDRIEQVVNTGDNDESVTAIEFTSLDALCEESV